MRSFFSKGVRRQHSHPLTHINFYLAWHASTGTQILPEGFSVGALHPKTLEAHVLPCLTCLLTTFCFFQRSISRQRPGGTKSRTRYFSEKAFSRTRSFPKTPFYSALGNLPALKKSRAAKPPHPCANSTLCAGTINNRQLPGTYPVVTHR